MKPIKIKVIKKEGNSELPEIAIVSSLDEFIHLLNPQTFGVNNCGDFIVSRHWFLDIDDDDPRYEENLKFKDCLLDIEPLTGWIE